MQEEGVDRVEKRQTDGHQGKDVDKAGDDVLEINNMVSDRADYHVAKQIVIMITV